MPPATYWFEARAMVIPDVVEGRPIVMLVDREIRRPALGNWQVTVRRFNEGRGSIVYCNAHGSANYSPQAELPEPLTLDWWTEGKCPPLTPGEYVVTTRWAFEPQWTIGDRRSAPLISNAFTVMGAQNEP
jgi:hypothetical protein